jgi:methylmalonyl-CoA mutase cobalamin-binding domain/chain
MSGSGGVDFGALLPGGLPDGREVVRDGVELGKSIERSVSLYCAEKGVTSEREWREKARRNGIPCTCMNIGLATWDETREGLVNVYEDATRRGVRPPDRFNLLAERRMGLPKELRASAPQETGPVLWDEQDWWELAHTVPIQPEAADNMIGGPGSVDNVVNALTVGITYVGVLSQYAWRWPYWDDEISQLSAVLTAAGALAAFRDEGVVFDSYLEDGYPGVFHDYANYVGWAMLERYVAEELAGAAYSCSWGGLTQNPIVKSAVTLALDAVHPGHVPAAFLQGDTIGNTADFDGNMAVLSTDLLFSKMTDLRYGLGSAPIAVPVTELERIPSWQEIAAVQAVSRRMEHYLPIVEPYVDWQAIEQLRDVLAAGGRRFFDSALSAMEATGVDVLDPAQVLFSMKALSPAEWEQQFGAGEPDETYPRGRKPVLETDLVRETMARRDELLRTLDGPDRLTSVAGLRAVVASTDVHEFAKFLLASTLERMGARVIDAGINRDPEDVVKVAVEAGAEAVVLTTHNGVARSFASKLVEEMGKAGLSPTPVFMGGVLNEDVDGSDIPVDVRADLHSLGVRTPATIEALVESLGKLGDRGSDRDGA